MQTVRNRKGEEVIITSIEISRKNTLMVSLDRTLFIRTIKEFASFLTHFFQNDSKT
jgi:hypothetical protein